VPLREIDDVVPLGRSSRARSAALVALAALASACHPSAEAAPGSPGSSAAAVASASASASATPQGEGFVSVECSSPCEEVRVDGVFVGSSPVERYKVAAGPHRLSLRAGDISKSFGIDVVEGRELREKVGMDKEPKPISEGTEEETLRAEIEEKISQGSATKSDVHELIGICGRLHDRGCILRAKKLVDGMH
jgi:hypothetical protein